MNKMAVYANIDGSSAHKRNPILDSGAAASQFLSLFSMMSLCAAFALLVLIQVTDLRQVTTGSPASCQN